MVCGRFLRAGRMQRATSLRTAALPSSDARLLKNVRFPLALVRGSDLLDSNQLSVARTAIAQAGGVAFRRFTPTEG
jgi:hypothetical protein